MENVEQQTKDQSKTVHVKFQLQRECSFGQLFLIVGDDLVFGMWDPTNAVALNWSVGHDVPIGKPIKFKSLLKRGTEEILWQPGPNRIIQTWETNKTITVCEDWENAELQKLIEEKPTYAKEDPVAISNKNLTIGGNVFGNDGSTVNVKDLASAKDDGCLVSNERVQVLVPGLLPTALAPVEVETSIFADASIRVDKAKDLNVLELDLMEEPDSESPHSKETTEMMFIDEKEQDQRNTMPFDNGSLPDSESPHSKETTEMMFVDKKEQDQRNTMPFDNGSLPDNESPHSKETTEMMFIDKKEQDQRNTMPFDNGSLPDSESPHSKETTELMFIDEKEQDQRNTMPFDDSSLENDIKWGRRTLQKLLTNLGFL